MLKILIINTIGLKFDGITNSIVSYLKAMDRSDMKIDFVLANQNYNQEMIDIIEKLGCGIYNLPARKKNPIGYFFSLYRLIRKNQYPIIHAHGNSSTLAIEMWAAKLAGCKIRIAHSRNTRTNFPAFDKLLRPLFYISYSHGFACGVDAGKWLFGAKEFRVIPNGKDISVFAYNCRTRREYRNKLRIEDKIVIGHAGNFNYQKNHEFLIKIFKELVEKDEHYILYLMGDGELRPQTEKMVDEYGLTERVYFAGSISNMPDMLQAMDIMVFPSRFEGLPNVVLEWQIACLPSVISDAITEECKLTDLVTYISLEDGPAAWAEKIHSIKVIDREEIASTIIKRVQEAGFDITENAKQLKTIYRQLQLQD